MHHLYTEQEIGRGWKPGAISKKLLRMLKKAKCRPSLEQQTKPMKKLKKKLEDKPTLIVCKRNGDYIIEMQVDPENGDQNMDCSPLIYKIASANDEEKVRARERKERRLIRLAEKEIWSELYQPKTCEDICLKAYQHAVGMLAYDSNAPECICPEGDLEEVNTESCSCEDLVFSSECSSLDLDWEIHFSPPTACKDKFINATD